MPFRHQYADSMVVAQRRRLDDVSKGLRIFRETVRPDYVHFYRNFHLKTMLALSRTAPARWAPSWRCARGRFWGAGENIGTGRVAANAATTSFMSAMARSKLSRPSADNSTTAIIRLDHLRRRQCRKRIADALATAEFNIQKRLHY